ncbi:hypothetical protein QWY82_12745 [Simiduia curdlanivorans]|uniref:Lysozyme inhibitor LprI N-terminal domain-containing protein n=1 Tax=Simiduia curdlanivorans TaxID=1492769 RepID=A0ABV8VA42_9GAMM|nr:hypothetical protein [Simiduia curdlanivorans]MDN3639665.1 hypothetical protein [Simiduia curdlanivorans]
MKKLILTFGLLGLCLAQGAYACDEMCKKEAAEKKLGTEFPKYLTWKYCDGISGEFMTSTMKSLQSYTESHLDTTRKRGMRNTKNFLEQRKDWLTECDNYIAATGKGRVFKDDKTTNGIFDAIDGVTSELDSLMKGVTYATQGTLAAPGSADDTHVAQTKFYTLFTLVDNHKNMLLLKGHMITSR